MEMLPMVQIVPEMNLALDPASGILGASLGSNVVILSMEDVDEAITKMEQAADDLIDSFDPYTSPSGAYAGREGSYVTAGMLTNIVYGFIIAVIVIYAAMPLLVQLGVL